jgi:hypothetical protein
MRGRLPFVLLVAVLAGPTYLACQLVDPASDLDGEGDGGGSASVDGAPGDASDGGVVDAASFCEGVDAYVCDGFDVDGPLNLTTVTHVQGPSCDGLGAVDVTGGRLTVDHQTNDGSGYSNCALVSDPSPSGVTEFTLDFDYAYQLQGDYTDAQAQQYAVVSTVNVEYVPDVANDAGIDKVSFQLLMSGQGSTQFIAVVHSPKGDDFHTFQLCNRYGSAWMPQKTSCHISLAANTIKLTGTATARCGTTTTPLTTENDDPPPGITAPATLNLGYTQNAGTGAWADWLLSYDNLVFQVQP